MTDQERGDFLRQVAAYQDGGLPEADLARLDLALREDAEKRALFIEVQERSGAIVELCRREAFADKNSPQVASRVRRNRTNWLVAAALSVAGGIALFVFLQPPTRILPDACARITFADQVHWASSTVPESSDYLRHQVPYQLEAGAIRLRMQGGGIVSIAGPASFTIVSSTTIDLRSGKLVARLPDPKSELVVQTDGMQIRDLGTAFGVTAKGDGAVDVAVFDGSVAVRFPHASSEQTLFEGSAISSMGDEPTGNAVPYDSGAYQDIWPLTIGIDEASGIIDFVPPGPQVPLASLAHDHKLFLVPEQLNHHVGEPLVLDLVGAGQSWPTDPRRQRAIDPDRTVSSYLVVYQPESKANEAHHTLSGSISFQHPILGVAVEPRQLRRTDSIFGAAGIDYASFAGRRLEHEDTERGRLPADSLRISDDGRQLYFHLNVGALRDHIRVLVDEDAPLNPRSKTRATR